jgi:hypothetical protein
VLICPDQHPGINNEHFTSSPLLIVANRAFSLAAGVGILFYKSKQATGRGAFSQRFRPASPLIACVLWCGKGGEGRGRRES